MKQFRVIKTETGKALKEEPTMKAPEVKNNDFFLAYGHIKKYEQHLSSLKQYPIAKEYENSFELDDVIQEDEFEIEDYCNHKDTNGSELSNH